MVGLVGEVLWSLFVSGGLVGAVWIEFVGPGSAGVVRQPCAVFSSVFYLNRSLSNHSVQFTVPNPNPNPKTNLHRSLPLHQALRLYAVSTARKVLYLLNRGASTRRDEETLAAGPPPACYRTVRTCTVPVPLARGRSPFPGPRRITVHNRPLKPVALSPVTRGHRPGVERGWVGLGSVVLCVCLARLWTRG